MGHSGRRDLSLVNTSPEKLLGAGLLAVVNSSAHYTTLYKCARVCDPADLSTILGTLAEVIGLASNLWGQTEFLFSYLVVRREAHFQIGPYTSRSYMNFTSSVAKRQKQP